MKLFGQFSVWLLAINNIFGQTKGTSAFDFAYQKEGKIYVYSDSTKTSSLATEGTNPCISPDGRQVAYTWYPERDVRQVFLVDLQTRKTKKLPINNDNFYGARWSLDGKYIAFNVFNGSTWDIGLIDTDNNFKIITGKLTSGKGAYSPSWTTDSKNIVVHDLESIYVLQLDGTITDTYSVKAITKEHYVSSNTRFVLSADKKLLIFNGFSEDKGFEEPADAVYSYDFASGEIFRITPNGLFCFDYYLQDKDNLLFTALDEKTKKIAVYKIKMIGQELKLLFKNGREITGRP